MSDVIDRLEWRSIGDVVFMSFPAASDKVAAPWTSAPGVADGAGGVDQADVAEGLGVVADRLSCGGVHLFAEQADVVGAGGGGLERPAGRDVLTGEGQRVGEPEGAQQEGALLACQPVGGTVAIHQPSRVGQLGGDG